MTRTGWAFVCLAPFVIVAGGACGAEVPAGGVKTDDDVSKASSHALKVSRRVEAEELFPRDLDFCLRVDLERLREMTPASRKLLSSLGEGPLFTAAIEKAHAVTFALRFSDLEAGDRVIALEGEFGGLEPEKGEFQERETGNRRVRLFERTGDLDRTDIGAIVALDQRALVFVSPAEVDSVRRVLVAGADKDRPDPPAEGVVSVHYRPHRLARPLEEKFPSVGKVIAGLGDVRGSMSVQADGLLVDLSILAKNPEGALRAAKFFDLLRANADDSGPSRVLKGIDAGARRHGDPPPLGHPDRYRAQRSRRTSARRPTTEQGRSWRKVRTTIERRRTDARRRSDGRCAATGRWIVRRSTTSRSGRRRPSHRATRRSIARRSPTRSTKREAPGRRRHTDRLRWKGRRRPKRTLASTPKPRRRSRAPPSISSSAGSSSSRSPGRSSRTSCSFATNQRR